MNVSEYTVQNLVFSSWVLIHQGKASAKKATPLKPFKPKKTFDLLQLIRHRLDRIEVDNPELAHHLCKAIPAQCPFERDIKLLGRTLIHIPPLCKLNPFYEEFVALRFRALCYLADECGEDISAYC